MFKSFRLKTLSGVREELGFDVLGAVIRPRQQTVIALGIQIPYGKYTTHPYVLIFGLYTAIFRTYAGPTNETVSYFVWIEALVDFRPRIPCIFAEPTHRVCPSYPVIAGCTVHRLSRDRCISSVVGDGSSGPV
jgi:hypothetical protein